MEAIRKITSEEVERLAVIAGKAFVKQQEYLDKKFRAIDEHFHSIDKQFESIDKHFVQIEQVQFEHSTELYKHSEQLRRIENTVGDIKISHEVHKSAIRDRELRVTRLEKTTV